MKMTKNEFVASHEHNVCIAYEQGFGYGAGEIYESDVNPYPKDTALYCAWDYGYSEGEANKI